MSDIQFIEQSLAKVASRRRKERAFKGFWKGLLVGSLVCLVAVVIFKLAPVPLVYLRISMVIAVLCPFAGMIAGGWRKNSVDETARWVDGRVKLQERLSSALEFARNAPSDKVQQERWRELLVADAANHAKELDTKKLVQFRMPTVTRWALLIIAAAIGLGFLPEYRSKAFVQKKEDAKIIKEAGKELVELTKRNMTNRPPAVEPTQKAMEAVNELGQELTKKAMTRSEALQKIANMADKLKDQLNEANQNPAMKRLEQAARSPGGQTSPEAAKLQKQIAEAQKQMGNNNATPDDMDKLEKELSKAQQEATKATSDNGGKMSQADKDKLSKSLAALSKQAQDMGMQMPNLDRAMEALASNQPGLMMKDLQQATLDLEKTKDMAKSLQTMQQQMEKMGKDLAEQLKNGQPDQAKGTIDKMIKDLKMADLTPEQLKKLLAEVSKAVDPAGKYGEVAKHLKEASKEMKDGDKKNAADALAKASDELQKLQDQAGDAESLAAELEGLNKASMSVGTCQSWSQCTGSKPGMGKGGKPGSGVGTWADENAGWGFTAQQTDHWDNTGVVRPDTDPKGKSDRPSDLNDALKPTKVKGQFSPGGQMPSITLKGVSIRGQSKVAYEEAAVAAQADAQSALSQEKVPRAYQAPVRDYFDDLKK
jgi:hypothetical protein